MLKDRTQMQQQKGETKQAAGVVYGLEQPPKKEVNDGHIRIESNYENHHYVIAEEKSSKMLSTAALNTQANPSKRETVLRSQRSRVAIAPKTAENTVIEVGGPQLILSPRLLTASQEAKRKES